MKAAKVRDPLFPSIATGAGGIEALEHIYCATCTDRTVCTVRYGTVQCVQYIHAVQIVQYVHYEQYVQIAR